MADYVGDHEKLDYEYEEEHNTSEDEDNNENIFDKKQLKKKQGRRKQWPEAQVDDLIDIIIENDKFKEKLLMTNVKNVKNSQYYDQVIQEIKQRCEERNEEFLFDVKQTRQKFKRCVTICRNAVMKVKTASGIKRFQEDKELGNWFGKLLPLISSMDNCQPQQSIEPGHSQIDSSTENDAQIDDDPEKSDSGETSSTPDSSESSGGSSLKKRRSYVPTPTVRKKSMKTENILGEIKETVESLKTLSSENSSKEILEFLKEESKRQSDRDNAFFQLMTNFLQPQPPAQPMYQPYPHVNNNQPPAEYGYRYGMTNMRPASATLSYAQHDNTQQESYTSQMMDPNYP